MENKQMPFIRELMKDYSEQEILAAEENFNDYIVIIKDIEIFWAEFDKLLKVLRKNKIPFFQSTTSLLHFLLDNGYDCIKPDLVVMKVAKKLRIVDNEKGDNNFRTTVKTIQQYSVDRKVRATIVDFYFLIDEGQLGSKKFVNADFYRSMR